MDEKTKQGEDRVKDRQDRVEFAPLRRPDSGSCRSNIGSGSGFEQADERGYAGGGGEGLSCRDTLVNIFIASLE